MMKIIDLSLPIDDTLVETRDAKISYKKERLYDLSKKTYDKGYC